jgi:hypothetical protein
LYCLRKIANIDGERKLKTKLAQCAAQSQKQFYVTHKALVPVCVPEVAGTRHGECSISSNEVLRESARQRHSAPREKGDSPWLLAAGSVSRAKGCVCVSPCAPIERVSCAVQFLEQFCCIRPQQQQRRPKSCEVSSTACAPAERRLDGTLKAAPRAGECPEGRRGRPGRVR